MNMLQTALALLYSLVQLMKGLTRLITGHPDFGELLLADDLISAFNVLNVADEPHQPIAYLESVEGVLSDTMVYGTAVSNVSREQWTDVICYMDAIRILLHDYRHELERAAHQPDRYHFPPHNFHDGNTDIPDHFMPALRELCLNINHVLVMLQSCHEARKFSHTFAWNQSLLSKIEQCRHEMKVSLEGLNTRLLPKIIYQASLDVLFRDRVLFDITEAATPQRYRLVDCAQLIEHNVLCIHEFIQFPHLPYAAISYVWRGNEIAADFNKATFSVEGARDADPISVEVLQDACMASRARGASYLWLDRLCIMQTNRDDKRWQISEMYRLYSSCVTCIVIPSGLHCLAPFHEETQWIHRGWTLQEVVAPIDVVVLFAWNLGQGEGTTKYDGENSYGDIEEIRPNRSAITRLPFVLDACTVGHFQFKSSASSILVKANLFGIQRLDLTSPTQSNDVLNTQRANFPHTVTLSLAINRHLDSDDMKNYAIWKSALMRTFSRLVDMVFSIMGVFGVTLDTSAFGKNDRVSATVALAQAILKQGRRASWLGVAFQVPPCPQISTFPTFPRTSVAGKAFVSVVGGLREVSELLDSDYPNEAALGPLPQGSMDDDGYFTFDAKAVSIVLVLENPLLLEFTYDNAPKPTWIKAIDGSTWSICENEKPPLPASECQEQAFAVLLGFYNGFPAHTTGDNVRAMLIIPHAPQKFHVRSYFMLNHESLHWASNWTQHSFSVGGQYPKFSGNDMEGSLDSGDVL